MSTLRWLLPLGLIGCAQPGAPAGSQAPAASWTLDARGPVWTVDLTMTGLRGGSVRVELPDFGDWRAHAPGYLAGLDPEGIELPVVAGSASLAYRITPLQLGDAVRGEHPLIAHCGDGFCVGFAWNLLARPEQAMPGTLEISAPEGWSSTASWAEAGPGRYALPDGADNGVIGIGRALGAFADDDVIVAHLGGDDELARAVGERAGELRRGFSQRLGHQPPGPLRIVVTEPPGWGTNAGSGIHLTLAADRQGGLESSATRFLAHEIGHSWIGHAISPTPRTLVWLREGWNEYLAMRAVVEGGWEEPGWFADRLESFERQGLHSIAIDRVDFGDPELDWRADPELEKLAYALGALLAFAVDAEVGLVPIVRDWLTQAPLQVDHAWLRADLEARGLGGFVASAIDGSQVPGPRPALLAAGFERGQRPTELTWIGVLTDARTITGLAPGGPAERAGARIGDRIVGWYPARNGAVQVPEGVIDPFPFGLTAFEPGRDALLDVNRDGDELQLALEPELRPGGLVSGWVGGEGFFAP